MQTFRVRITPSSAFGSRPLGDTLFGQLCWAVRNRHGEGRLAELLAGYIEGRPWAVVSDAFPTGYLPRPSLPGHWFAEVAGEDRKAVKKRAWFPVESLTSVPVEDWLAHCRPATEVPGSAPQAHPQPHNTINRMTGTTGEGQFAPYAMNQLWYGAGPRVGAGFARDDSGESSAVRAIPGSDQSRPGAATTSIVPPIRLDVYVVLDENRLNRDELAQLFEDIGAFGFGRDASIGLGKFKVIPVEAFAWPRPTDANAYLTLAPCAPQGQGFDPERSFYQTFTRFGRHGDIGVHLPGGAFKTPILMAQTGAVFAEPSRPRAAPTRLFVGQGLGGGGSLSKAIPETVHQGYAPVVGIRLPSPQPAPVGRGSAIWRSHENA
jgi:CRISPR-associated protein Csm4